MSKLVIVTLLALALCALVKTDDAVPPGAPSDKPDPDKVPSDKQLGRDELPSTKPDADKVTSDKTNAGKATGSGGISLPAPVEGSSDKTDSGGAPDGVDPIEETSDKTDAGADGAAPLVASSDKTDGDDGAAPEQITSSDKTKTNPAEGPSEITGPALTEEPSDKTNPAEGPSDKTGEAPAGASISSKGNAKTEQFQCKWLTGKGVGLESVAILEPPVSGQECVDKCYEMRSHPKSKKTKIDAVVEYKDESKEGCWCIYKSHDLTETLDDFQTCYFNPEKALLIPGAVAPAPASQATARPVEYTCANEQQPVLKGCYKTNNKRRYFLNKRLTIDWTTKGHPNYAQGLVCACAEAAKNLDIDMFATHFWGECWELKEEDLDGPSDDGCMLADGLFETKKCDVSTACLGTTGFAVHTYM